jgi:nicotinic acid mononucleotide adenylyltransferase
MDSVSLPPINNNGGGFGNVKSSAKGAQPQAFDGVPNKSQHHHGTIVYDEDGHKNFHSPGRSKKLPPFTEAYTSSPSTAGIPVLEIVRRLEEEKALRKEDREALNEALYDGSRREKIIKTLGDIELGVNPKFAIKRLRALIHGNMGGEISSSKVANSGSNNNAKPVLPVPAGSHFVNLTPRYEPPANVGGSAAVDGAEGDDDDNRSAASARAAVDSVALDNYFAFNNNNRSKRSKNKTSSSTNSNASSSEVTGRTPVPPPGPPASDTNNVRSTITQSSNNSVSTTKGNTPAVAAAAVCPVVQSQDDDSIAPNYTQLAVERVVGQAPLYSGPDNFNCMNKIIKNFQHFVHKRGPQVAGGVKFAIIVGTGSFNPLTRMHMRTFFLAKEYLESKCGFCVLGSLLSPAHAATVRERYRTDVTEVIPSPHRVAIAQLMVEESRHLEIDPWEITRRRAMDYLSLMEHTQTMVKTAFGNLLGANAGGIDIKILYLCKANMVPKISPVALKADGFGCICVCRAPDSDNLRESLTSKWSGLIWIVEDTAILDASFDVVTSRRVRDNIKAGTSVDGLVGKKVQDYIIAERLGPKV